MYFLWTTSDKLIIAKWHEVQKLDLSETKCHLNKRSVNYKPWVKSGPLPVFENKVLFEHSHAHLFECYLWLLSQDSGRAEEWQETVWPLKPKICATGPLQKRFVNPWSKMWFPDKCYWHRLGTCQKYRISDSSPRNLQFKQGLQVILMQAEV